MNFPKQASLGSAGGILAGFVLVVLSMWAANQFGWTRALVQGQTPEV